MKESAGEANITVITIVLIGVIAAIATPLITNLMKNSEKSSCCQANGGVWKAGKCYESCDINGKNCTGSVSTKCQKN